MQDRSNRSNEVIKQLTRLANDRNISTQARNQILEAARHIKDLHRACTDCRLKESEI